MDDCRFHIHKEIASLARRSAPLTSRKSNLRPRSTFSAAHFRTTPKKAAPFWQEFRRQSAVQTCRKDPVRNINQHNQHPRLTNRSKSSFLYQLLRQEDQVNKVSQGKESRKSPTLQKLSAMQAEVKVPKRDLIQQHLFKKMRSGSHSPSNSEVYLQSKMGTNQRAKFSQTFFKLYKI